MTYEEHWQLHYLENAEIQQDKTTVGKIKDKVSNLAHNIVHENKLAVALRKAYYDYALIHKEKWLNFITDPKKTSEPCDAKILATCFDILGNLPVRREIKHDYGQLKAKLLEC